jgi:hypothetical protein
MMFIIPIPPTIKEIPAMLARSKVIVFDTLLAISAISD